MNLAAILKVGSDLMCRLEQFEGQPITIKKRQRSVTPIRTISKENSSLSKDAKEGRGITPDVKKRKATKIVLSATNRNDNVS
jgi:hypothetical protein